MSNHRSHPIHDLIGKLAYAVGYAQGALGKDVEHVKDDIHQIAHDVQAHVSSWATSHLTDIFAVLRTVKPIVVTQTMAIVTRFYDVEEVLARDEVFRVPYASKFSALTGGGGFLLGVDDSPVYQRDSSTLQKAIRREDIPTRVIPVVQRASADAIARAGGRMNVVRDLGEVVLTELTREYFGVTGEGHDLADWSLAMSAYLFIDTSNNPALTNQALADGAAMRALIDRTIAARKAARGEGGDDVLARLLKLQHAGFPGTDDMTLRNNLLGIIVGAIPTTAAAVGLAIDELFRQQDAFEGAVAAAHADDDQLLSAYVFEALRLNPLGPGVFRNCAADYTVASGQLHATMIPKGVKVLAALQSAMDDGHVVPQPRRFRIDRPSYVNLLFGYGMHTCFGRYMNAVQIPLMVKALLRQPHLRRAPGADGQLVRVNAFPTTLNVEFGDPA